ncbi:LysM-like peptidoglycan-binding domain-containing protein [Vibrio salinus]|uniref:LysM-like peptidoglycan-binding domain-containing protein n=1 Tax=Vibrio salinus TaxID=2899784 RepID=UPI001E3708B2|nr:LysM-like peptidoglycan-binding domain-containing protein [Vibrio salinus]MCE0494025.1 lysine transporter LysM [Vibrio salinus]
MNHRRSKESSYSGYFTVLQQKCSEFDFQLSLAGIRNLWDDFPTRHKRILMGLVTFVIVMMFIPLPSVSDQKADDTVTGQQPKRIPLTLNAQDMSNQAEMTEKRAIRSSAWVTYTIKNGDTLSKVFRNNDLSIADLHALVRAEGPDKPLSNIRPGQLIRFKFAKNGQLDILQLEKSDQSVMFFRLSGGGFGRSK